MAIRKLIARAESDPDFSSEEIERLKTVADAAQVLLALGRGAKWVIFILAALAGAMTAWTQVKAGVRAWLGG